MQQSKKHFPTRARPGLSGEGETLQNKCTSVVSWGNPTLAVIFVGKALKAQFVLAKCRDILCTRLPRKMLHKMFLAVLAFFLVAVVLQGCGCDEDEVKKCAMPTTASGACKAYSQCLKDASCCDFEQNGAKMKDAVAAACTTWKLGGDSSENLCA